MKHAVIIAHPNPGSLTVAAGLAYAQTLGTLGHDVTVRDLYRMDFDPCLKATEIPGPAGYAFGADVVAERAILADVDVFAFVYPFWFNAPPAILMGFVDRVFGMDFGFRQGPAGNEPRLAGRRLISFSFSGAPDQWVRDTGALAALEAVFENHICNVCGLRLADHLHTGGIVPDLRKDAFEDILSAIRDTAIRNFGAQAPQLAE